MQTRKLGRLAGAACLAAGVAGCSNPYDPAQRTSGGALLGAGSGAAIGALAGGGRGAAIGAVAGGLLGAVTGAATTPQAPPAAYYRPPPPVYYQPPPVAYYPPPVAYVPPPGYGY